MLKEKKNSIVRFTIVMSCSALLFLSFGSFSALGQPAAKLPQSPIKTVYITPLSHYDFGFVEPPDQVRERAAQHIDRVIDIAEKHPSFRWTIESMWQVNEWMKRQQKPTSVLPKDKQKIARLMKLIKSGQIELSTAWGSMHTDFLGAEELNRMAYDYTQLSKAYGVKSEIALMNDVPGHPTSIPAMLAGSGTKYLVTGANLFLAGSTSLAPGKVPFYWESPDGSRVLTWISPGKRGGYVEGLTDYYLDPYTLDPYTDKTPFDMFNPEMAGKKTPLQVMEIGVTEMLNRYNNAGYKYDSVMVMFAHDFLEPTAVLNLERAIKMWNSTHKEIQLKVATPTEFLTYIEKKYAAQIPTHRGEWSGLWSEAKTHSPKISALARYAHDHTPAAETLWSAIAMKHKIPYPVGNISNLYDLMLTYDEHSGAGNNGWPQLNGSKLLAEQNRQYVRFMEDAKTEADRMLKDGVGVVARSSRFDADRPQKADAHNMVVYNAASWMRSDVVRIAAPEKGLRITGVRDLATDKKVAFDIDANGEAVFVAADVPSMGYKSFEVTAENGNVVTTLKESSGTDTKNNNFHIKMRADGNVQSIVDLRTNREIVNDKGELPFNALLRVEGDDASKIPYPVALKMVIRKGDVMTQIVVERPRSAYPLTVLTSYDGIDRVEIHNQLDPKSMPFIGGNNNWGDSYYFAFPVAVSAQNLKILRGGQRWFDRLPDDYLPGARQDGITTQHMIGMTDGNSTAMLAHRQSFHWVPSSFVEPKIRAKDAPKPFLPAMFMGKYPLPEATLYSRAYRDGKQADTADIGITNVETVEPGMAGNNIFDYAVAASGSFSDIQGWRFGADFNVPLRGTYVTVAPTQASESFFSIDQPNVQIVTVKSLTQSTVHGEVSGSPLSPTLAKTFIIRLQEFAGRPAAVKLGLPVKIKSATQVNLTEDKVIRSITQIAPLSVNLKAYETVTVRVEID